MSMSYHIKQQVVQDFFPKVSHFSRRQQTWIPLFCFCFLFGSFSFVLFYMANKNMANTV